MRTREVISRLKKFTDYYGFDLVDTTNLKTKKDCLQALEHHKKWLEDALNDATKEIDRFIEELGIESADTQ